MSVPGGGNSLLALGSAALWGGGDFSGGMGVKHVGGSLRGALRVVLLSHLSSFLVLVALATLHGDVFPHGALLAWGVFAGATGGLSLTCFYIALSRGDMGVSAAVSGLLAAAIPAFVASISEGSPGLRRMLGFCVAGVAIWLVAAGPTTTESGRGQDRSTAVLAILAGAGFGVYFVALKMAGPAGLLWPMATARIGSISTCSVWALAMEIFLPRSRRPSLRITRSVVLWSLSTALLDTSGNLLFVAATRAGRLDIAAVLASLYPASTILLAAVVLSERPTRRQAIGMLAAAIAVGMISA